MIPADRDKSRNKRRLNHICRILRAAQPGFQHHDLAFFVQKIQKSNGCLHLKSRRMRQSLRRHRLRRTFNLLHILAQPRLRDRPAVHLKDLPVIAHRGRTVSARSVSGFLQHCRDVGKDRTFSVGSRYMYEPQLILRIAKTRTQLPHGRKPHNHAILPHFLHIGHRLFIVHVCAPFCFLRHRRV